MRLLHILCLTTALAAALALLASRGGQTRPVARASPPVIPPNNRKPTTNNAGLQPGSSKVKL